MLLSPGYLGDDTLRRSCCNEGGLSKERVEKSGYFMCKSPASGFPTKIPSVCEPVFVETSHPKEQRKQHNQYVLTLVLLIQNKLLQIPRITRGSLFDVPIELLHDPLFHKRILLFARHNHQPLPFRFVLPDVVQKSWTLHVVSCYNRQAGPQYANVTDRLHPDQLVWIRRVTKRTLKEIFESLYDPLPLSDKLYKLGKKFVEWRLLNKSKSNDVPTKIDEWRLLNKHKSNAVPTKIELSEQKRTKRSDPRNAPRLIASSRPFPIRAVAVQRRSEPEADNPKRDKKEEKEEKEKKEKKEKKQDDDDKNETGRHAASYCNVNNRQSVTERNGQNFVVPSSQAAPRPAVSIQRIQTNTQTIPIRTIPIQTIPIQTIPLETAPIHNPMPLSRTVTRRIYGPGSTITDLNMEKHRMPSAHRESRSILHPNAMGIVCFRFARCMVVQTPIRIHIFPCKPPPPQKFIFVRRQYTNDHKQTPTPTPWRHQKQPAIFFPLARELASFKRIWNPEWCHWFSFHDKKVGRCFADKSGLWQIRGPRQFYDSGPFASSFVKLSIPRHMPGMMAPLPPIVKLIPNHQVKSRWVTLIETNGSPQHFAGCIINRERQLYPSYQSVNISVVDSKTIIVNARASLMDYLPKNEYNHWWSVHLPNELQKAIKRFQFNENTELPHAYQYQRHSEPIMLLAKMVSVAKWYCEHRPAGIRPFREDLMQLQRLLAVDMWQEQKMIYDITHRNALSCASSVLKQYCGCRERITTFHRGIHDTWTVLQTIQGREELLYFEYGPGNSKMKYTKLTDVSKPSKADETQGKSKISVQENGKTVFESNDGKVTKDEREREKQIVLAKEKAKKMKLPPGRIAYKIALYVSDYVPIKVHECLSLLSTVTLFTKETQRLIIDYLGGSLPYQKRPTIMSLPEKVLAQIPFRDKLVLRDDHKREDTRWCIVKLIIPDDAKVTKPDFQNDIFLHPRKMRSDKAFVAGLEEPIPTISNLPDVPLQDGLVTSCFSAFHNPPIHYVVDTTVHAVGFNSDVKEECAGGIHFHWSRDHALWWIDQTRRLGPQLWQRPEPPAPFVIKESKEKKEHKQENQDKRTEETVQQQYNEKQLVGVFDARQLLQPSSQDVMDALRVSHSKNAAGVVVDAKDEKEAKETKEMKDAKETKDAKQNASEATQQTNAQNKHQMPASPKKIEFMPMGVVTTQNKRGTVAANESVYNIDNVSDDDDENET